MSILDGSFGDFNRQRRTSAESWHIDLPLLLGILTLVVISMFTLYSSSSQNIDLVWRQILRFIIAFGFLFVLAQIEPNTLKRWVPWVYILGVTLLLIVMFFGDVGKGAQRWLDLGLFRFQPSEIMKLAVPLMVAWYLSEQHSLPPNGKSLLMAALIIGTPVILIAKQPDLGTAILVASSGIFVLFFAGISWRLVTALGTLAAACAPIVWYFMMHDYQRRRVITLLNPESDPLGAGYHIIQSKIAIGSGGIYGKGWLNGSQSQLNFLPEHSTDFIFAAFSEEFGLLGISILLTIYLFLVVRGILIAVQAQDTFTRLTAGSLTMTFFIYVFVNIGMVIGLLPVVGVPLPLISYGGTSIVTLMASFGILMSIQTHRKFLSR
ncbi:MAG: rod shape-determining protein RodA [Gammaproteobacteria bacterium]|nr:rod shape-determining protein RodA [Gammaproteobacteria bacterium]MDH5801971.1 rod shape-determining protein RodA [Gammaproteobacteria bacterium]